MNKRILMNIFRDIEEGILTPEQGDEEIKHLNELMYYKMVWKPESCNVEAEEPKDVLVFLPDKTFYEKETESLFRRKTEFIVIVNGDGFQKYNSRYYQINMTNQEDFKKLIYSLKEENKTYSYAVQLLNNTFCFTDSAIKEQLNESIICLFDYLKAAIGNQEQKIRFVSICKGENPVYEAVTGFSKSIRLENPNYQIKQILLEAGDSRSIEDVLSLAEQELCSSFKELEIQYNGNERFVRVPELIEKEEKEGSELSIRENSVFVITGGMGGLGRLFASYLAKEWKANIVLIGRTKYNESIAENIEKLQETGTKIQYMQADITNYEDTRTVFRQIKEEFGAIHGLLHCAGTTMDQFFIDKNLASFYQVIGPKVLGTANLLEVLKEESLDYFIMFSSLACISGNAGQCDYAYGNSFMNHIARIGKETFKNIKTIRSICWPLWENGGMQIDSKVRELFQSKMGMKPLSNYEGINAFYLALQRKESEFGVLSGDKNKLLSMLLPTEEEMQEEVKQSEGGQLDLKTQENLKAKTQEMLINIFSDAIKLPVNKIDPEETFDSYGIDSIVVLGINEELEKIFGELSKTLLFQYQSIEELTNYFIDQYSAILSRMFISVMEEPKKVEAVPVIEPKSVKKAESVEKVDFKQKPESIVPMIKNKKSLFQNVNQKKTIEQTEQTGKAEEREDIAIVGISGRYPEAVDLDEFWKNLKSGKDCITEIPKERWNWKDYYTSDKTQFGKMFSKWGGFLKDIDQFDALFFNISPREAEFLDPQEKLFLESCWLTAENAGYTKQSLKNKKVGVFVGVMYGEHQIEPADFNGTPIALSASYASIANRVSYVFGLQGPSIALDTMCSSSLTAIHLAVESLRKGESEMAFVGGVNLNLHPNKYKFLSQQRFLSSDGRCRAFGDGGDGYVPAEGVGSILIKPLKKAKEDHDYIYAVIKGTAINHGGKANGYTVPNPNAQTKVILEAAKDARVDLKTVNYIEAHGTGTALGDPIEITGAMEAFHKYTDKKQFCSIGSVKSNIGHAESAAGIAAITKVVLQLQHKELVPSIHSKELNGNINFENTPFYVQQADSKWNPVEEEINGSTVIYPRRAGVSSFGAGGANAHIILEEYKNIQKDRKSREKQVVILSAKNKEKLNEYAKKLETFLESFEEQGSYPFSFYDFICTLQFSREEMPERLAIVAADFSDCLKKLRAFIQTGSTLAEIFEGNAGNQEMMFGGLIDEEETMELVNSAVKKGRYEKIAKYWVSGANINWNEINKDSNQWNKVPLPGMPMDKISYKIKKYVQKVEESSEGKTEVLNRYVHRNTSTPKELRFTTSVTKDSGLFAEYQKEDGMVVSYDSLIQMILHAYQIAAGIPLTGLYDVIFAGRIYVTDAVELHTAFHTVNGKIDGCEIYTEEAGERILYVQAKIEETDALELQNGKEVEIPSTLFSSVIKEIRSILRDKDEKQAELFQIEGIKEIKFNTTFKEDYTLKVCCQEADKGQDEFEVWVAVDENEKAAYLGRVSVGKHEEKKPALYETMYASPIYRMQMLAEPVVEKEHKNILVFVEEKGLADIFYREARERFPDSSLSIVSHQNVESIYTDTIYKIVSDSEQEYSDIVKDLMDTGKMPQYVLYLTGAANDLYADVETVLYFSKALQVNKYTKQVKMIYPYSAVEHSDSLLKEAMAGMVKSIQLESPNIVTKCISIQNTADRIFVSILVDEMQEKNWSDLVIRYDGTKRMVEEFVPVTISENSVSMIDSDDVILLTGGMGRIGRTIASYLLETYGLTVALIGRSKGNRRTDELLDELSKKGGKAYYFSCDITNSDSTMHMVNEVKQQFGKISGIIQCAGVIKDNFIIYKTMEQMHEVMDVKIKGTLNLDRALKEENLKYFILFSSIASVNGNMGQCDYACANRFLDAFADIRSEQVKLGERTGKTITINWPLWKDGGMHISSENEKFVFQKTGFSSLPNQVGLQAFQDSLKANVNRFIVCYGNKDKIEQVLLGKTEQRTVSEKKTDVNVDESQLYKKTIDFIRSIFEKILNLPAEQMDELVNFQDYGIDSNTITYFNTEMDNYFEELPKTVLFQFQNLKEVTEFLIQDYKEQLISMFFSKTKTEPVVEEKEYELELEQKNGYVWKKCESLFEQETESADVVKEAKDIAIIGVSGKYPESDNIREFWKNIAGGRESVSLIPKDRWDYEEYYDEDYQNVKEGKMYCKWGAFLDDVDKFDPLFFKISPAEAEIMDPQERLFIESSWEAMEDAGYIPRGHGDFHDSNKNVGVFVGVTTNSYQLWGPEEWTRGNYITPNSVNWSIANRVSYLFDFHGPSIPVDTACSSSLTAVHLAVESIRNKECEMALAGGVNLYLHPYKYVSMSQLKMLSPSGHCHTFSEDGDGFLPGEGVGAILLKPLDKAVKDGDHIYGIIKGSAVNHGGATNGYTVPNQTAQTEVIIDALKKAGINPRTVSYIEAHGTGTKLGDPIEIQALSNAYKKFTDDKQFCAIGSLKTNIGHLESAAGIAGITKILAQLKYKKLVPSLHAEHKNSNINFNATPFYVQETLSDWEQPILNENGVEKVYPRIAGISAFGAGGSNNHIIIQEYVEKPQKTVSLEKNVFVLSAKTQEVLKNYVTRMTEFLQQELSGELKNQMDSIMYTLQTGREEMSDRVAVAFSNEQELMNSLQDYLCGRKRENVFEGKVKNSSRVTIDGQQVLKALEEQDVMRLARMWTEGASIDWKKQYPNQVIKKVSLPTYPFRKDSYYITRTNTTARKESVNAIELKYVGPEWREQERIESYSWNQDSGDGDILAVFTKASSPLKQIFLSKVQGRQVHVIDLQDAESHLIDDVVSKRETWKEIYFFNIQDESYELESRQDLKNGIRKGIVSVFRFIQSLNKNQVWKKGVRFKVITNNVHDVVGREEIYPYAGGIDGFIKTMAKEYPDVQVSCMDIDKADMYRRAEEVIEQILGESFHKKDEEIAFRGGRRYQRFLVERELHTDKKGFERNKTYLIAGGLGNVGYSLAKYVAEKYKANLILLGRSQLDEKKKNQIRRLEKLGSEVLYVPADITSVDSVREAVLAGTRQFGTIHGVVHSVMSEAQPCLIAEMDEESLLENMAPKADGIQAFCQCFEALSLDFILFISSGQSFTGNPYRGHYAAACCFEDAYVNALRNKRNLPVKIVNLGFWGTVDEKPLEEEYRKMIINNGAFPLTEEEGHRSIELILESSEQQIYIMKVKDYVYKLLNVKTEQPVEKILEPNDQDFIEKKETKAERSYIYNKVAEAVMEVLQLGKEDLDDELPFMEFGLDSISASKLVTVINEKLEIDLEVTILFDYATIEKLTDYILNNFTIQNEKLDEENRMSEEEKTFEEDDVEAVFAKFQQGLISEEELDIILGGMK